MSKPLRLLIGLFVLFLPMLFGWYFRNPLIIPVLSLIYVPLYFLGKMGGWQSMGYAPSRRAILKAVPLTFFVQTVLVGMFYLIGLGLGALFTNHEMAKGLGAWDGLWIASFALITLPLTLYIAYAEGETAVTDRAATDRAGQSLPVKEFETLKDDEDEFAISTRIATPETFYNGPHFSRHNAAGTALTDVVDHKGSKPKRTPLQASDAMIAATEGRLGVKLPDTLRKIYRLQDGGGLPTYYVPRTPGAPQNYDNWISAFADDYNDLKPLAQLKVLQDDYDEHFDPAYDDEEDKAYWIPGSDKLIILTARTGYGTALDYRGGGEPGILLFDHNNEIGEMELKKFGSFDDFLASLREVVDEHGSRHGEEDMAYGPPPNPLHAEDFWSVGNSGAGVDKRAWQERSHALGVPLPDALFPFYKASNGGTSKYKVALPLESGDAPLPVFPVGPYVKAGNFLRLEQFVSLATLSDRLDFTDEGKPWRDIFEHSENLIVISAAFDSALLLDYSQSTEPGVLVVPNLDAPDGAIRFASVSDFLMRLRRFGNEAFEARNEIGDLRISPRQADAASFWIEDETLKPVPDKLAEDFTEKWGLTNHGLPAGLNQIYARQNGGKVRFRYAPPQVINPHGYRNYDMAAKTWLDAFPDGLLQLQSWQPFADWRKAQGLATAQSLYDFSGRITEPYDDDDSTTLNLFVIGDHTSPEARMVTLLDLSTDSFTRNRNIMTLRHNKALDEFEVVFGPMMVDNIYSGIFQTVKARISEL